MNNPRMTMGDKLNVVGRLVAWPNNSAHSKKRLDEMKTIRKFFAEKDLQELDKKLRCIKRC